MFSPAQDHSIVDGIEGELTPSCVGQYPRSPVVIGKGERARGSRIGRWIGRIIQHADGRRCPFVMAARAKGRKDKAGTRDCLGAKMGEGGNRLWKKHNSVSGHQKVRRVKGLERGRVGMGKSRIGHGIAAGSRRSDQVCGNIEPRYVRRRTGAGECTGKFARTAPDIQRVCEGIGLCRSEQSRCQLAEAAIGPAPLIRPFGSDPARPVSTVGHSPTTRSRGRHVRGRVARRGEREPPPRSGQASGHGERTPA